MSGNQLLAVPKSYRGVMFRSTLEADWAATLDSLSIAWQYEPEAVQLPSGERYRCDFYLPEIATWLEVKGPHDERIGKTLELAQTVWHWPDCQGWGEGPEGHCCATEYQLVVIGRPSLAGSADWELLDLYDGSAPGSIHSCGTCGKCWWQGTGFFSCRAHRRYGDGRKDLRAAPYIAASDQSGMWYFGEHLPFQRASQAR